MKRSVSILALCVLLVAMALPTFADSAPVKIWVGGQVAEIDDTWNTIVTKFTKETGIKVDVQFFGFDVYYDKLLTALQAGSGPDLAFADLGGWAPTFASKGWLEPLDKQINSWDGKAQIWKNLWPTVTYQKKVYGLPWYTDARLLLINQKMLKDAGLDPNASPKTWDDLAKTAQALTHADKNIYGYGVSGTKTEHTTLAYIVFLYGNGGKLLTDDYKKAAFNTPEGLAALKFYTDLALKYKVSPNAISYNEDDYRNLMAQGRVAMAIGGPWSFPLLETANPDIVGNYTLVPHPYGKQPASVLGGWGLVVPKASKNKENAWKLATYLDSKDTWMYWISQKNGPMPARMDVCNEAPRFQSDAKWKAIFATFPNAVPRPPIATYPQVSDQIQSMIQNVLLGQKTPEQAIADAAAAVDKILK
jgi:multiple sugar transport system substrate-binding protein